MSKTLEEEPYVWSDSIERNVGGLLRGPMIGSTNAFIAWWPGRDTHGPKALNTVCLDGDFAVRDLEAIIAHMRKHGA